MGTFSYICQICQEPIIADTTSSGHEQYDECTLWLLREGVVVEKLEGKYTGYGSVEIDGEVKKFEMPWDDVLNLIFAPKSDSGIAACHRTCLEQNAEFTPKTQSEDDPNQGWLPDDEDEDDYLWNDDDYEENETY